MSPKRELKAATQMFGRPNDVDHYRELASRYNGGYVMPFEKTSPRSGATTVAGTRGNAVAGVLSGVLLGALNTVTAAFVLSSWIMWPDGQWDRHGAEAIATAAFFGGGLALATLLPTSVVVVARWLPKWLFLLPGSLVVLAIARLGHISAEFP